LSGLFAQLKESADVFQDMGMIGAHFRDVGIIVRFQLDGEIAHAAHGKAIEFVNL
jgi:hypothetical protein